jgi:hypothetical protein
VSIFKSLGICAVCVVITTTMVMLLRDFGAYGIMFMTMSVYYFRLLVILDGKFASFFKYKTRDVS